MKQISRRQGLKLGLAALASAPLVAATAKQAQAATHAVTIAGFAFGPEVLQVAVGDTVVFTNQDGAPHTATAEDGSFDTGRLSGGDSGEITIESAGEFPYICKFHPSMRGMIVAS